MQTCGVLAHRTLLLPYLHLVLLTGTVMLLQSKTIALKVDRDKHAHAKAMLPTANNACMQ